MQSRKQRRKRRVGPTGPRLLLVGLCAAGAAFAVWLVINGPLHAPNRPSAKPESFAVRTPQPPEIVDFYMADLDYGWQLVRMDGDYAELRATSDGGKQWIPEMSGTLAMMRDAFAERTEEAAALYGSAFRAALGEARTEESGSSEPSVRKVQFVTEKIGWQLVKDPGRSDSRLMITADGGNTWSDELTDVIVNAMASERERLKAMEREAAYFGDAAAAAMRAEWTLMPDTAAPGDVILVRSSRAGSVSWQGKDYRLTPFGAGYYTYLPIPIQLKPGRYPVGDRMLTVVSKTFDTQYLKVTGEQESMRQNTKRIQEDQRKIDRARSESQPDFLFSPDSAFVQPIQGRLTTPYGFTRYVNGKFDGSHQAIDLAAVTGTPVQATNDGIVVLAEELYLTGNSVYIDHGMHLFSQYAHLSKINVRAGDRVKKGDIIGLVGSTGFSTGPHLHFTFWAHNVPVNPNLFFGKTPFQWMAE
jgi:murein DD-endopeptidase MepM/ murein hydrolase activator NlpD